MPWKLEDQINIRYLHSEELSVPTHEPELPLVIQATAHTSFDFLLDFAKQNSQQIKDAMVASGGVLLRGFEVKTAQEFEKVLLQIGFDLEEDYPGPSPRKAKTQYTFSSTEANKAFVIYPHTEMAYAQKRPGMISFFCMDEPTLYGETPIFNCHRIYQALDDDIKELLQQQGVKYVRDHAKKNPFYTRGLKSTWPKVFGVSNKAEMEKLCSEMEVSYQWLKNDRIKIETLLPAIIQHEKKGVPCLNLSMLSFYSYLIDLDMIKDRQSVYLHQFLKLWLRIIFWLDLPPVRIYLGNGERFSKDIATRLEQTMWNHSVIFRWQQGDVLLLDNILTGHARLNVLPPRKILTAFGDTYHAPSMD